MAWTSPMTFTDGQVLTAAQLNTHLRDNLMETMPAKATTANGYFVATGPFGLAQRIPATNRVGTTQTSTDTSFGDLTTVGPSVTVTTGTKAWVQIYFLSWNSTADAGCLMSYEISGASSRQAADSSALEVRSGANLGQRPSSSEVITGLTPGSNTFTCKYRVTGGTGSFAERFISVLPL